LCGIVTCFFFFQAEDGIRDIGVTGVQTCALPIFKKAAIDFVNRQLGDEIIRLQQLQKVNPSISDVEIEQMQATLNQALKRIKEATLYLDAVRVVINNPRNK